MHTSHTKTKNKFERGMNSEFNKTKELCKKSLSFVLNFCRNGFNRDSEMGFVTQST